MNPQRDILSILSGIYELYCRCWIELVKMFLVVLSTWSMSNLVSIYSIWRSAVEAFRLNLMDGWIWLMVTLLAHQLSLANKSNNDSSGGQTPAPPTYEEATAGRTITKLLCHYLKLAYLMLSHVLGWGCTSWYWCLYNLIVNPRHQCSLLQRCGDAHRVHLGWSQYQEGLHP